jgi:glutathione-regulated potassium-efflux system protein KefB
LARAGDREEAYTLKDLGADFVFRETRESAVEMGKLVLRQMGKRANQAEQMAFDFLTHDEEGFEELFQHRADRKTYISLAKQRNAELERLILSETPEADKDNHGWD